MLDWAKIGLGLIKLFNTLADLFRSKKDREAGANQAILDQKEATDALTQKAVDARRAQSARDAAGGLSNEPDKYRRD